MGPDRDVAAQFRKGKARRTAAQPVSEMATVDTEALLRTRETSSATPGFPEHHGKMVGEPGAKGPSTRRRSPTQIPHRDPTELRSVRSMFVPGEAARGMRVLALLREVDHAEIVIDASRSCAEEIPRAETHVGRRRRVRTERLQLKLSDAETALIDRFARERNMTRSTFLSLALERYVASAGDRMPGR